MFKSTSKNSSRRQSSESLNNFEQEENVHASNQTINLVLDNHDKMTVLQNKDEFLKDYNDVNEDPLGKILIDIVAKNNKLACKQKEPDTLISMPGLIQAFKHKLSCEEKTFKDTLKIETENIKEGLLYNKLHYHTIAPRIKCPDYFSPTDILVTPSKYSDIIRIFPKGRDKFTGHPNQGPDIQEFLHAMNMAQSKCKLSLPEFLEFLTHSCTKEAHSFVRALVEEKATPETIYFKLLILYDQSPAPEAAKQLLLDYKVKRNENLAIAQAYILDKASIIAKICISDKEKKLITDFEGIQALPRALPPRSAAEVNKQYRILMTEFHRPPTFIELVSSLDGLRVSIDDDIKQNGAWTNKIHPSRYINPRFKTNTFSTRVNNNNKTYNPRSYSHPPPIHRGHRSLPYQNKRPTYNVNNLNTQRPNTNQFMNKNLSCILCGRTGHTAVQQCYQLRDAEGKNVPNVSPSQEPCPTCLKVSNKRLFHPEKYCFIKNAAPRRRTNFRKQ